jgi:putative ABC transport system permease protein
MTPPPYSRTRPADLLPLGTIGLRSRRLRAVLSMLGIAIGIAAIVAVLGITRSSQSDVLARIDRLGTNLLTVVSGHTISGDEAELPTTAAATIGRTAGVQRTAPTSELASVPLYRTDRVPTYHTGGLAVRAADASLLSTLDGTLAAGVFLNGSTAHYPVVVLGHDAAAQLGIARLDRPTRIWLGGHWFTVIGILRSFELAPEIDRSALIGFPIAADYFGYDGHPSRVYVRADTTRTAANRGWQPLVPPAAIWAGLGAALLIGAVAGLYPAHRAARLSPTDALRTV